MDDRSQMMNRSGLLEETIDAIRPADEQVMKNCRKRWNQIGKPLYSLGWLEDAWIRIAGAVGTEDPEIEKKIVIPFCADNGIVEEGVSQAGQEVTAIVAENFLKGKTCTNLFCQRSGADLRPVDVGMMTEVPGLLTRKVRRGTRNFALEPALTMEETVRTIETGIRTAREAREEGYQLAAAGEMGIGNTTTSAAVAASLLNLPAEKMTGRGAGLHDDGLRKKVRLIGEAIRRYDLYDAPVLRVLSCVGGLDLAAMTGFYLGAASVRLPVVLDGLISCTAALAAVRLCPAAAGYMTASHLSSENAAGAILEACHLKPVLHADMHLGEGSGAAAIFPLLDMASDVYRKMDTFEGIRVSTYEDYQKEARK